MIAIAEIPGKGRGVIALEDIHTTQVLEVAPTIHISADERDDLRDDGIGPYSFANPAKYNPDRPCDDFIVFGLASFANHSDHPNAMMVWGKDSAKLLALSSIDEGEEVTIRYTDICEYNRDGWTEAPAKHCVADASARVPGEGSRPDLDLLRRFSSLLLPHGRDSRVQANATFPPQLSGAWFLDQS